LNDPELTDLRELLRQLPEGLAEEVGELLREAAPLALPVPEDVLEAWQGLGEPRPPEAVPHASFDFLRGMLTPELLAEPRPEADVNPDPWHDVPELPAPPGAPEWQPPDQDRAPPTPATGEDWPAPGEAEGAPATPWPAQEEGDRPGTPPVNEPWPAPEHPLPAPEEVFAHAEGWEWSAVPPEAWPDLEDMARQRQGDTGGPAAPDLEEERRVESDLLQLEEESLEGEGGAFGGAGEVLPRLLDGVERMVELLERLAEKGESPVPAGEGNAGAPPNDFDLFDEEWPRASPSVDMEPDSDEDVSAPAPPAPRTKVRRGGLP
jgi:hypothetical protein